MVDLLRQYRDVWFVDLEFQVLPGERPEVLCLVAREYRSGRTVRLSADELVRLPGPPFPVGSDSLVIAYYSSAELGCHLALGWPLPMRILDLFVEFRCLTNGLPVPSGNGLLGALAYFGLDTMAAVEKTAMRDLAMRGGPYSVNEQQALLNYCEADVLALDRLLSAMISRIDLPRALLRGRYMAAAARMEHVGVPIDSDLLVRLRRRWEPIKSRLVEAVDVDYGVYVGGCSFSAARWERWLNNKNIPWPRLDSGALDLRDDAFREMAKSHTQVAPIRELRHSLSQLRLNDLAVGADGRNRCLLSAFQAKTGRNQPSNARFIFGPSCWLRGLIKPEFGRAVAYVDYEQQEFGIAAALSGDAAMMAAYESGDPYLEFAKQAAGVPPHATKQSHGAEREKFKTCVLGVQYAMGPASLAAKLGEPEIVGRELLELHRRTYPAYWRWSQAAVDRAMLLGELHTVFGWRVTVGPTTNARGLRNFPMQANGAEMLRLACCLATEAAIEVCAPVHDALLAEGPADEIDHVVTRTQAAMREASEVVLGGFALRTDAKVIRYPDRYDDPRGARMWATVMNILTDLETYELSADTGSQPVP